MTNRVQLAPAAFADLAALDAAQQDEVFEGLPALAADPYGRGSIPYPGRGSEDDRTAIIGTLSVDYMVSGPPVDPSVITVTRIHPPKKR